jgi:hypothetical protein
VLVEEVAVMEPIRRLAQVVQVVAVTAHLGQTPVLVEQQILVAVLVAVVITFNGAAGGSGIVIIKYTTNYGHKNLSDWSALTQPCTYYALVLSGKSLTQS